VIDLVLLTSTRWKGSCRASWRFYGHHVPHGAPRYNLCAAKAAHAAAAKAACSGGIENDRWRRRADTFAKELHARGISARMEFGTRETWLASRDASPATARHGYAETVSALQARAPQQVREATQRVGEHSAGLLLGLFFVVRRLLAGRYHAILVFKLAKRDGSRVLGPHQLSQRWQFAYAMASL